MGQTLAFTQHQTHNKIPVFDYKMWFYVFLIVAAYGLVAYFFFQKGPKPIKNFAGKHVLITGGSGGLGLALACQFAELGSKVSIIARNQEKLRLAQLEVEKHCKGVAKVLTLSADVTKYTDIEEAVRNSIRQFGAPDITIINAGVSLPGYFSDTPIADLDHELKLNYVGSLYTAKAVLPELIKRGTGGHINFVSSAAAFLPFIGYSNYAATKAAVKALADGLRNELKRENIDVSVFFPTGIDTEGFAEEQKRKPIETKEIEGKSSLLSPKYCATCLINAFRKGKYYSGTEFFPTELLRCLAHGFGIRDSWLLDIILAPILIIVSPFIVWDNDRVVLKHKKTAKKSQ